ncbi:type II secretion system protein GspD [Chlamydia gallinacea]|uniref:type II secretion system protein GspD n=1 Tax=Chlamydia gallinacea TaxID=1457153 RepID=UPI0024E1E053|nr:type II secretion system protein GspD [Chlamydia gallinacea]
MRLFWSPLVYVGLFGGLFWSFPSVALTIAEKAASLESTDSRSDKIAGLASFNANMKELNLRLQELYEEGAALRAAGCQDEEKWQVLRNHLQQVKEQIRELETLWAAEIRERGDNPEDYALWHHPEATIYNLVADYGEDNVVYLVPQDIGMIKISAFSRFAVPKEGFQECLEHLLARLGIGVRQISPWIKELYITRKEGCGVIGVFSSRRDLDTLPSSAYIGYVISSKNIDVRADQHILKKCMNTDTLQIDIFGGKLWIFGSVGEINELLKIYDFVQSDSIRQEYRIIPLTKIDALEMISILKAAFQEDMVKEGDEGSHSGGLKVVPLQYRGRSLFLSGTASLVYRAVDLIKDLEESIENPTDKTVFWYNVKHSDPQELASLLSQVHDVFSGKDENVSVADSPIGGEAKTSIHIDTSKGMAAGEGSVKYGSFIADSKTGTLIMVIEREALSKIKMLLKKLDVPKKMVRIEVLLFERKLSNQRKSGLNLLRLGEEVCKKTTSLSWTNAGILEFLFKGNTGNFVVPSYDLAYQFLMAQEDVRINASPSVITVNQTPAKIAIVEEMSIAVAADKDSDKIQYNRAQYGIMIKMLPIINIGEEDGKNYISLETDITFDTTGKIPGDTPNVTRRNITNKVRIADGETVIIGGLRCKHVSDSQDGIPFLGEIPGMGKLFGMNATSDSQTEMFVFITPKILESSMEQQERHEEAVLASRPGEIDEFRRALFASEEAVKAAHKKLELISAVHLPASRVEGCEYDGR